MLVVERYHTEDGLRRIVLNKMLTLKLKQDIKNYAFQFVDEEIGGVLIENNNGISFFPCANLSYNKNNNYILSYLDYIKAEKHGKIIAMVHSQENDGPSILDNISAINFNLYSIIYCWKSGNFYVIKPELKDYLYKNFTIGVNDCFSLMKDYFKNELNINISNYSRKENWHIDNPKIMLESFGKEGFIEINDIGKLKLHDVLLFGKNKNELYHIGIYQENNLMLHHPRDSKSCIEDINLHWLNKLMLIIRHKSLL